jgi:uncharacterized membrane protein
LYKPGLMNKRRKKEYPVIKKHYLIPLALCIAIIIAGIIMTVLNQSGYGLNEAGTQNKDIEVTGPGAISIGVVLVIVLCFYIKDMYKKT